MDTSFPVSCILLSIGADLHTSRMLYTHRRQFALEGRNQKRLTVYPIDAVENNMLFYPSDMSRESKCASLGKKSVEKGREGDISNSTRSGWTPCGCIAGLNIVTSLDISHWSKHNCNEASVKAGNVNNTHAGKSPLNLFIRAFLFHLEGFVSGEMTKTRLLGFFNLRSPLLCLIFLQTSC